MTDSAEELIEKVMQRYAQCASYADAGVITGPTRATAFKTYFQRDGRFRFEWLDEGDHTASAIWCDGKAVYKSVEGAAPKRIRALPLLTIKQLDLPVAIGWAASQSQGTAEIIPTLLMRYVGRQNILKIGPYAYTNEMLVAEHPCYHIRSDWRPMCSKEILIDKESLAIMYIISEYSQTFEERAALIATLKKTDPQRADQMYLDGNQSQRTTTEYQVCNFNTDIPDSVYTAAL